MRSQPELQPTFSEYFLKEVSDLYYKRLCEKKTILCPYRYLKAKILLTSDVFSIYFDCEPIYGDAMFGSGQ